MKKISLSKETVRKLNAKELRRAYGGGTVPNCCDTNVTVCDIPETCVVTLICAATTIDTTTDTNAVCDTGATCKGRTCGPHC